MPGTEHIFTFMISINPGLYEVASSISHFILQIRKLRLREVAYSKSYSLNPGLLDAKANVHYTTLNS